MTITIIAAIERNGIIGSSKTNDMPWGKSLKADLRFFKAQTNGHVVVMGRNTFRSLGDKVLPGRFNIVLTSKDMDEQQTLYLNFDCTKHIEDILKSSCLGDQIFIIGGASVYNQFLPYADEFIITHIDGEFEGDISFPLPPQDLDDFYSATVLEEHPVSENNPYKLTMKKYTPII